MKTVFIKKSITAYLAQRMIEAAVKKAEEIGKAMAVAILDESGNLKVFHRMDGSALVSIEVAQNKAYTSVANAWGHATHEVYEYSKKDPALSIGLSHIARYTILGGGFPIKIDNEIVGGIGVSGGTAEQDIEVAKAALLFLE